MTAASYSWPRKNLLLDGGFEDPGSTTDFNQWTEAGTVTANNNSRSGTYCASIAESSEVYQNRKFVESAVGRWADQDKPMMLTFWIRHLTGSECDGFRVQFFIANASGTIQYSWDFYNAKWVASPSTDSDDGESFWVIVGTAATTYSQVRLPKIDAPSSAGSDVVDGWQYIVRFANQSSNTCTVGIDDVVLSEWVADTRIKSLGRMAVCYNGVNYPVKHDERTDAITELSLNWPYWTDNSALPTEGGATTGGEMEGGKYFGVVYTNLNDAIYEESGVAYGVESVSGAFTVDTAAGTDTNTVTLDFSAIEYPNSEIAKDTDNTDGNGGEITGHSVYRTIGYDTQEDAEAAVLRQEVYWEGDVADGATFTCTLSDDDLREQGERHFTPWSRIPAKMFNVAEVYRSRLWTAGGRTYRLGECTVTQNSHEVVGTGEGGSDAPTHWGRGVEDCVFKVDGDSRAYRIERYFYTDDDGGTSAEKIYLTEPYEGTSGGNKTYTIRPRNGVVWWSEEGQPHHFSDGGFFTLDGDEGEAVTGLVTAQNAILAMTRSTTFMFNFQEYPGDQGTSAAPISRDLGCIAKDSPAEIRGVAYWLSAEGVVRSDGTRVEVISNALQDMFTDPDDPDYIVREPWTQLAQDAQGVHYGPGQQYLLAVKTKNARQGCDVVLVYNYFFESWDIYRLEHGLAKWSPAVDDDGNEILLFSDPYGQVYQWDKGFVDGAGEVNNSGVLRGRVSAATALTLTVSESASLFVPAFSNQFTSATLGLQGAYVKITKGTGAGQIRRVSRVNNGVKYEFNEKWDTTPDTTSEWELGGIDAVWNFKNATLGLPTRVKRLKFLNVDQKKLGPGARCEVRVFREDEPIDYLTGKGLEVPVFLTSGGTRIHLGMQDAAGYSLRFQITANGPEAPLEVRGLSATMVIGEQD